MVLFFSGTGNSKYVADYIADELNEPVVYFGAKIKRQDYGGLNSQTPFVIVTPTYCWRIPHIVRDGLIKTTLSGSKDAYFVMTCGSDVGNAEKYLKRLCAEINMNYCGCGAVVMPENYIAMFDTPNETEAHSIISDAENVIFGIAQTIKSGKPLPTIPVSAIGKFYSGPINKIYYKLVVKDKKFKVNSDCIGCGLCEKLCPTNNIALQNARPSWHGKCTHCMACIAHCPKNAIEYAASRKRNVYVCPTYGKKR